jgi:hypothetical protein
MVRKNKVIRVIIEDWEKVIKDRELPDRDRHYSNKYIMELHECWQEYEKLAEKKYLEYKTERLKTIWFNEWQRAKIQIKRLWGAYLYFDFENEYRK